MVKNGTSGDPLGILGPQFMGHLMSSKVTRKR